MIASVINWVGTLIGAICVWAVWASAGIADGLRWVIQGIVLAAWDKIQREFFSWCGEWCVQAAWYLKGGLAILFSLLVLGLLLIAWVFFPRGHPTYRPGDLRGQPQRIASLSVSPRGWSMEWP